MFTFAHKLGEYQSLYTDELFNQQLLAKGLLLTTENALQRAIDDDAELKAAFQKIRQLRIKASDAKTLSEEAASITLDADRQERLLSTSAHSIHHYLNFLKIHVDEVRTKLRPADAAIEFVDYRVGKDSTMYAALVMCSSWEHVLFIPLAEEKDLLRGDSSTYSLVWKPVIATLPHEVRNIYFAPTGLLYQLPLESLPTDNEQLIGETFNLYRLSSTRWLAFSDGSTEGKDAVIYGGLRYDTSIEEMEADARLYPRQRSTGTLFYHSRGAIGGIPYLPGTKKEAETIAQTINNASLNNLHAETFIGQAGTEASFKALGGKQKRIIHIASHGFYQAVSNEGTEPMVASVNALSRSGLLLAGADNKYQGEQIPEGIEDGILTAHEISQLDLRGLDLVCLSACQTGQGEITSDGVFGLQRGFKKAGVESILMSLWKVDDEATCLLMTEFYKNWFVLKKTKHDALQGAKQTVRSHKEKGWDDPKYWAAFILLDAMD